MGTNRQGWICILNEENFEIVKKNRIYGIPPNIRALKKLRKVGLGDTLFFYVISPVKCIKGVSRVTSNVFNVQEFAPWNDRLYPYRINDILK